MELSAVQSIKLRITFIVILAFCCKTAVSQNFAGGLTGGFTTSQINGDENSGFHKLGATVGCFVEFPFDVWSQVLELRFSQKGSAGKNNDFKINLGYVDMAYYLHYPITNSITLKIGCNASVKAYENTTAASVTNKTEEFGKWDFQALGGAEFYINNRFAVDIHATYSVFPIENRYRNCNIFFTLRYYIIEKQDN